MNTDEHRSTQMDEPAAFTRLATGILTGLTRFTGWGLLIHIALNQAEQPSFT